MDFDVHLNRQWKRHQSVLPTDQLAAMRYVERMNYGWKVLTFRSALHRVRLMPDPPAPPVTPVMSRWERRRVR